MAAIGGSIEELTIAGRGFAVTADNDVPRKFGGTENEVMANGNGTSRVIQTRVAPSLPGWTVACDDVRRDQEFLQDIANAGQFVACTVTYAGGQVYQGDAVVTGELVFNPQAATCSFDLGGTGTFTPQQ